MRRFVSIVAFTAVVMVVTLIVSGGLLGERPAGAGLASPDPLLPTVISPTRGDIRSILVLDGVLRQQDAVDVKAGVVGMLTRIAVVHGGRIEQGGVVASIESGLRTIDIRAPVAGVVIAIDAAVGDEVGATDSLMRITPSGFEAIAQIAPSLLYRLYARPVSISVEIDHGPATFDCPFSSIGPAATDAANPLDAPVYLTCAVPPPVRAFSGIRVQMVVTTGEARNVLVVPVEAVRGSADTGVVTVVRPDGTSEVQTVSLGLTDGVRVQIRDGLAITDHILEFPAAADRVP